MQQTISDMVPKCWGNAKMGRWMDYHVFLRNESFYQDTESFRATLLYRSLAKNSRLMVDISDNLSKWNTGCRKDAHPFL